MTIPKKKITIKCSKHFHLEKNNFHSNETAPLTNKWSNIHLQIFYYSYIVLISTNIYTLLPLEILKSINITICLRCIYPTKIISFYLTISATKKMKETKATKEEVIWLREVNFYLRTESGRETKARN